MGCCWWHDIMIVDRGVMLNSCHGLKFINFTFILVLSVIKLLLYFIKLLLILKLFLSDCWNLFLSFLSQNFKFLFLSLELLIQSFLFRFILDILVLQFFDSALQVIQVNLHFMFQLYDKKLAYHCTYPNMSTNITFQFL